MLITKEQKVHLIKIISQYWWPVKLNYSLIVYSWINWALIKASLRTIEKLDIDIPMKEQTTIVDIFAIKSVLEFIVYDLWVYEFSTCTWLDYYNQGIKCIELFKDFIIHREKDIS